MTGAPRRVPRTGTAGPLVLLETATLLSGTGNGVATVALPWLILERTGSATAAGLVAAATALPLLVSGLFSGTLVDLLGRRRTAVLSDLLSGLAVAAIPLVDLTTGLSVATLAALAALGAVFDPAGLTAREAMLPEAAARARWHLERANGVHEAIWGTAYLIGPGLGGVLIAWTGAIGALWVTAAGFLCSAAAVAAIRLAGVARPAHHDRPAGLWRGTREGLAFIWHDRLLRSLGLTTTVLVAVYLPIEAIVLPVYFQAQARPEYLGLVVMAMSAGGVVGALTYGALAHRLRRRPAFLTALAATAVLVVAMAPLPPFPVLVVLSFGVGVAYGPVNPLLNYAMQTRAPQRLRGRVVGVLTSLGYAGGPAGYLLVGPFVQRFGVRPAFLALALTLLVIALAACFLRSLRELDRPVGTTGGDLPADAGHPLPHPGTDRT